MKIILEHMDIDRALQNYLRDVMNVEVEDVHTIALTLDEDGHATATVTNAKPRTTAHLPVVQMTRPFETAAPTPAAIVVEVPGELPPFAKAIEAQQIDWKTQARGSTDITALGKSDLSDISDELGPPSRST